MERNPESLAMHKYFLFLVVFLLLGGCATKRPEGKTEAEKLFREAEKLVKVGRYILANEKLNRIRSKYPYSYYATFAELLGADVLFKQENYAEAAAAYIVFKDFHPRHKKIDYVTWRIGESFYKQLPDTHDRDLSSAFEAIKHFREVIRVFPKSEYAAKAKGRIEDCKSMIRAKEKYIADFYYKTDVYDAARFRYDNIIAEFQEPDIRAHSMIRAIESSIELKDKEYCQKNKDLYSELISKDHKEDLKQAIDDCLAIKN